MSAVDAAQRAARVTDPIAHSLSMLGMLAGMLIGAVVGAILIVGAIATGGALLIVLAACAGAGAVAMGGLSGGQLVRGLKTAFGLPDPQTGVLGPMGSPNVLIGNLFAARMTDLAVACDGLMTLFHPIPFPAVPIAEGAHTVRFNNLPAARVTSKLFCGAQIKDGEPTVVIGGPTERDPDYIDPEEMLQTGLEYLLIGSLVGVGVLTFAIGGSARRSGAGRRRRGLLGRERDRRRHRRHDRPRLAGHLTGVTRAGAVVAGGVRGARELGRMREAGAREQAERGRAEREQAEREQAEREKAEREQAEREKAEREKAEREKAEREQAEREKAEREKAEREKAEREKEKAEQEKAEQEKAEQEKAEQEKAEQEKAEQEKAEQEKTEREAASSASSTIWTTRRQPRWGTSHDYWGIRSHWSGEECRCASGPQGVGV